MKRENITGRAFRMYSGYNPKYFPLCFMKIIFLDISFFFRIWMSAEIINGLYEGKGKKELYFLVIITLVGIFLFRLLAAALDRAEGSAKEILNNREDAALHAKTLSLDYDKIENPDIRRLRREIDENKMINYYGTENMRMNVERLMDCLVDSVFSLIFFADMVSKMAAAPFHWLSPVLLAGLGGCLTAVILFQFREGKKMSDYVKEVNDLMLQENQLGRGHETIGTDNRIYRQQMILNKIYRKSNEYHRKVFARARDKQFRLQVPIGIFTAGTELCAYLIVCLYCTLGAFSAGAVVKYVGYLWRLTSAVWSFFGVLSLFRENRRFLETYLRYFDLKNDMYQGNLAVEKRSDRKFEIEFKDVGFRYQGNEDFALKDISLKVRVGERLAVVGMNGSGKTTFIKLLCRLYDPEEGEILMNDFNVRKYDYRQYLDLFSVVFQDYNLLAVPLGNNVAGAEQWDKEKAERVLWEVGFGERYGKMPKGLDTPLYRNFDADGVEVSGGEAQKIALARALYRDAPFIILDEPTAALDPIAEAEIYSKFDEIVGDKTAIYISHRLSSCRFCDRIAVFHQGRIVQTGTHEELLADKQGKYYELWQAQAQYYA